MTSGAAVGIDDDFPSGETGVAFWAADHESAGGVDEEAGAVGEEFGWEFFADDL